MGNVRRRRLGIGTPSSARDSSNERVVRIATDSSASKGIGWGKIRHLDTGLLWLQRHLRRKVLQRVKTTGTPADMGTEDPAEKDMKRIMDKLGFREKTGRHPKALRTAVGVGSTPAEQQDGSQLTALDSGVHHRGGVCEPKLSVVQDKECFSFILSRGTKGLNGHPDPLLAVSSLEVDHRCGC